MRVQFGRASVLMCPGADPKLMNGWDPRGEVLPVTAVLLPDGGYEAVNPGDWLRALAPRLVLISVESGNRRGLPSSEVLRLLEGTTVLRTDRHGWIELSTEGTHIWVEVERGRGPSVE